MLKWCDICKREKLISEFNVNNTRKDGLQTKCKECSKALSKAYQAAKVARDGRVCRVCTESKPVEAFELVRERFRARTCRDCRNQRRREVSDPLWRDRTKDRRNEKTRSLRKEARLVPRHVLTDSKRSDKKRGLENDLTLEFVTETLNNPCAYCGETKIRMSLDRIDNHKGHIRSNVIPSCVRCNYARGSMPYEAWLCLVPGLKEAKAKNLFGGWLGRARLTIKGC